MVKVSETIAWRISRGVHFRLAYADSSNIQSLRQRLPIRVFFTSPSTKPSLVKSYFRVKANGGDGVEILLLGSARLCLQMLMGSPSMTLQLHLMSRPAL
jgi:hypothetical protein